MSIALGLNEGGVDRKKASALAAFAGTADVLPPNYEKEGTINIAHILTESPMTGLMKGKGKTIKMELAKGLRLAYGRLRWRGETNAIGITHYLSQRTSTNLNQPQTSN